MITRSRLVTIGLAIPLVLTLVACGPGGGGGAAAPTEPVPAATDAVDIQPTPGDAPPAGVDDPPPVRDPSGVDWATVDLTTIDWATIDMRQVDWRTIEDNPTAESLDQATIELIGSRVKRGSATLTVGDQVWDFDNFLCAFGHVATKSELFSFSSVGTGRFDGVTLRLQVDIEDPSAEGRFEGRDVRQEVTLDDGETNSIVRWSAGGSDLVRIDGYSVTASGAFIDDTLDTLRQTEVPGALKATCADGSHLSP